jgi:protein-S-isoprenylcysteine O-methyltransferase Ste14
MPDIVGRFIIFAIVHSLLATDNVKSRVCSRWHAAVRSYRLVYNILAVGSLAWVLAALTGSPVLYTLPHPFALLFRIIQTAALVLLCRCAIQTGLADFLGIRQLRTGQERIVPFTRDGCYRLVRHPQYSLAVVFLAAAPVMSVNGALFTLLSLIYFGIGGYLEEVRLVEIFGNDYRRYQGEVPMFVPRWSRRHRQG